MLTIIKSFDALRFEELAALYGEDLRVEWEEDSHDAWDEAWFSHMRSEFAVYLVSRFFSLQEVLPDVRPFYAIWEIEGKYVSAVRVNVYEQGLLLEALCTAKDERGKGYAAALLDAVLHYISQLGHFYVYAQVRGDTMPEARLLQRLGFRKILDYAVKKDPCEWPPYYYRDIFLRTYLAET